MRTGALSLFLAKLDTPVNDQEPDDGLEPQQTEPESREATASSFDCEEDYDYDDDYSKQQEQRNAPSPSPKSSSPQSCTMLESASPAMSNNSTSHNNNNSTSHNNNNNNTSLGGDHHLYNGHKVVAMPSLGGMSVQKVVTSRNETRSRSAGRTPRSRDIVQEVYDRMGVSRDDLRHSKADQFHERYRAAAALSTTNLHNNNNNLNTSGSTNGTPSSTTTTTTATRGRSMEPKDHRQTDGNRRARSLSRGRKISSLWPPTNSRTNAAAASGGGTGRENDNTSTPITISTTPTAAMGTTATTTTTTTTTSLAVATAMDTSTTSHNKASPRRMSNRDRDLASIDSSSLTHGSMAGPDIRSPPRELRMETNKPVSALSSRTLDNGRMGQRGLVMGTNNNNNNNNNRSRSTGQDRGTMNHHAVVAEPLDGPPAIVAPISFSNPTTNTTTTMTVPPTLTTTGPPSIPPTPATTVTTTTILPAVSTPRRKASPVLSIRTVPTDEAASVSTESPQPTPVGVRTPSIKDRISVFAGRNSSNRNFTTTYPARYNKRDHPPQIDIYEEARRQQDETHHQQDGPGLAPPPSTVPPSPAAAAAADAAAELVRWSSSSQQQQQQQHSTPTALATKRSVFRNTTSTTTPNASGVMPSSSGTSTTATSVGRHNNNNPPMPEIAAADESGGVADLNSVALSSMSGDEFGQHNSPDRRPNPSSNGGPSSSSTKKPAWAERGATTFPGIPVVNNTAVTPTRFPGNLRSTSSSNHPTKTVPAKTPPDTINNTLQEMMDRSVEERVQSRMSEVEARYEAKLLKLQTQLEEKMNRRVGALESQIENLGSMLAALARSNRHGEI